MSFNLMLGVCYCIYVLVVRSILCDTLIAPTVQDQKLMFTSDYCSMNGPGYPQLTLGLQTRDDSSVYLITCATGFLVYRSDNQSTSTLLTLPTQNFFYSFPPIVLHPHTNELYFAWNGSIFSLPWNSSTLPTFAPPLTEHSYNRTICPYVCSSVSIVFSSDGSLIYIGCNTNLCDFIGSSYVVAIHLTTQQTIYINTTQREIEQGVSPGIIQLSAIEDTNSLLIVSLLYGITIYDTSQTQAIMRVAASSSSVDQPSTPTRVLLDSSACYFPYGTIMDLHDKLLISICSGQTLVWHLISHANISVDSQSGVVVVVGSE